MRGKVATATRYVARLPHQSKLESITFLSKEAQRKLKWIDYYLKHQNARKTCRYFGISQTTFYKWLKRYGKKGIRGLESRSRCPKAFRKSKVAPETIALISSLRKTYPAWSKYKLSVILQRDNGIKISASTVGRILKRRGLIDELKAKKRRKAAKRNMGRKRAEKHLKELCPGSLIYLDTKHLTFPGKRFYQFTAVDSKTRVKFIRIYTSASSHSGTMFLEELRRYMPFAVQNIQTDNGSEFLKCFHQALEKEGIPHYFSYPNCPKQNSKVERVIQTSEDEFWDFREGYTVEELNRLAEEWNYIYNHVRPHQALGYLTPMEFLAGLEEKGKIEAQVSTML